VKLPKATPTSAYCVILFLLPLPKNPCPARAKKASQAGRRRSDPGRPQRFYGSPSDADIEAYETELILLIKEGYLGTVTYGFRRDGKWIEPSLRYTAHDLAGGAANDDDPGRVRPGAETSNASFYSYLTYSRAWDQLSAAEKESFKELLPFQRTGAPEPAISGYVCSDRTYSSGGRALERASVRAFG